MSESLLCCLNITPTLSSAGLAIQDTGARAAAECGRLAVWDDAPLFSVLGVHLKKCLFFAIGEG